MDNNGGQQLSVEQANSAKIFMSYAHEDRQLHQKLVKYLGPLERAGKITLWHDQEILPGGNWNDEIRDHLNTANIILFLVSPDFLDSKYCWDEEVKVALERHKAGEARVLPILLRPAAWQDTPLGQLQLLPTDTVPITQWSDQDAALDNVVQGIRRTVDYWQRSKDYGQGKGKVLWQKFINAAGPNAKKIVPTRQSVALIIALLLMMYFLMMILTLFGLTLPSWIRYLAPVLVLPFVIALMWAFVKPRKSVHEGERRALLFLATMTISLFALKDFLQGIRQLTQLRMGFLPGDGDRDTNPINNDAFENAVKAKLGVEVSSQFFPTYTETVRALAQGRIEMAWLGPFSYLYAVQQCQPRPLLCSLTEEGSSVYYSYIIAKANSGIQNLQALQGQRFAIVDNLSTSGYLVPWYIFKKANIDFQALTLIISSSHPQVLQDVLSEKTVAGAISSTFYDEVIAEGKLGKSEMIILNADSKDKAYYKNYAIPSGPIVLRKDIQTDDALRIEDAFLAVAVEVSNSAAINTLNTKGFAKIIDSDYQMIRDIVQELHLDISQIPS